MKTKPFALVYDTPVDAQTTTDSEKKEAVDVDVDITKKEQFTQAEVNEIVAKERRKVEAKTKQTISELEALRANSNLTLIEKENLTKRIADLSTQVTTKEQQAQTEIEKWQKKYEKDVKAEKERAAAWETRYQDSLIHTELTSAAAQEKAFSTEQILRLLKADAKAVEEIDADGKPTGKFAVKVKMASKGADGKPVTVEFTPLEALKNMKDNHEQWGNLFEAPSKGGLGLNGSSNPTSVDIKNMSMDQYIKFRGNSK